MKNEPLVLVVDDQPEIARLVTLGLRRHGFSVAAVAAGDQALERTVELNPDIVLLDIGLPDTDGLEVLKELRQMHPVPVILLTARSTAADVATGLNLGADDYVVKPFHPAELAARIRAVIRRTGGFPSHEVVEVGDIRIDLARRSLTRGGRPVSITRTEWQLLQQFALNPGRILLHEELLTAVWGPEYRDDVVYLRLWVSQLRRKLGAEPWDEGIIRTVQGLGYAFDPEGRLPRMRSRRPGEAHEPGREAEAGTDDGEQPAREASLEREPAPAAEAEAPTGA